MKPTRQIQCCKLSTIPWHDSQCEYLVLLVEQVLATWQAQWDTPTSPKHTSSNKFHTSHHHAGPKMWGVHQAG